MLTDEVYVVGASGVHNCLPLFRHPRQTPLVHPPSLILSCLKPFKESADLEYSVTPIRSRPFILPPARSPHHPSSRPGASLSFRLIPILRATQPVLASSLQTISVKQYSEIVEDRGEEDPSYRSNKKTPGIYTLSKNNRRE